MAQSEAEAVGIDWDSGSWIAVSYHPAEDRITTMADSDIWSVWDHYEDTAERIVIDVPIGLCGSNETNEGACQSDQDDELFRPCDKLAREVLPYPRSTSVFNAPARTAMEKGADGDGYETVKEENKEQTGKGLTRQSANLADGIAAVDDILEQTEATDQLVEGHPEVCFQAFADGPLEYSKGTAPGVEERLQALDGTPEYEQGDWRTITRQLMQNGDDDYAAGLDDVLDATVLAVTAAATEDEDLQTLPQSVENDTEGRPMQMVYRREEPFDVSAV